MNGKEGQNIKHISDIVGELGRWQITFISFATILRGASALNNMGYSFHAYSNDYWCSDVPEDLPMENRTTTMKCFQYTNPNQSCTEWQYDRSVFRTSITTEFNLVCDRANFGSITQAAFMCGYVISGLVFAHYSDKYGRRPLTWISITIEVLGILISGVSVNIYMYIVSRFFVGLGSSGRWMTVYTILIEMCGPKYRSDILILGGMGWVTGYILTPAMAYWLQNFRHMQFVSMIPQILMMVWFYFLDESPRWQLTNGKTEKAEKTLRKALKMSGKSDAGLKEQMNELSLHLRRVEAKDGESKRPTLLDLFKGPTLRKVTLIIWYSWIVNGLIYYGFTLNMSDFGGDLYITFVLGGLVEVPAQLTAVVGLRFIGRSKLFSSFFTLAALACFAVIPCEQGWVRVMFALIGKYAINGCWDVMSIQAPELFPTVLRHTGMGASQVVSRIGSIAAPFMKNLALNYGLTVVMVLYGSLTTIGALLVLLLPETKGREIPDTLEEAENRQKVQLKAIN